MAQGAILPVFTGVPARRLSMAQLPGGIVTGRKNFVLMFFLVTFKTTLDGQRYFLFGMTRKTLFRCHHGRVVGLCTFDGEFVTRSALDDPTVFEGSVFVVIEDNLLEGACSSLQIPRLWLVFHMTGVANFFIQNECACFFV
jgi:hypothetical protein